MAQKHGAPGYVLIASICFWIASYFKYVVKNELSASCYYQLSVQSFYCAHLLKERCEAAINNVRCSLIKQPPPITNEYDFFYLLSAIEAGRIMDIIKYIQSRSGLKLLGKMEVDLARQNAEKYVIAHFPKVIADDDVSGVVIAPFSI